MYKKAIMSSKSCAGCDKLLPKHEFLRCSACKSAYDLVCLNMSSKRYNSFYAADKDRKSSWKCPECQNKQPKRGNLNTPVRPSAPSSDHESHISPNSSCDGSQNVTQRSKSIETNINIECTDSANEIMLCLNEMRAMRMEMSIFRETMAELTSAIKAQNKRLDNLESRIELLETKITDRKRDEVLVLEETISQLKFEIQERDQEILMNDIEISNFPEASNENATHILLTVAKKLGVELEERDVVNMERVGPVRAFVEGGPPPRPRPLVARLARRASRDALLRAARVRRGLTTEGMAVPGSPCPYYLNERLTKPHRQLFMKTREEARRRSWKYVWTREGRIFARREQGTPAYRIRSDMDVEKVFGVNIVSIAP